MGGISSRLHQGPARLLTASLCLVAATSACASAGPASGASADAVFPLPARPVARPTALVLDDAERDRDGESVRVMDALRIGPGLRVADLRSGTGYHAARLAARLGPAGVVYAEEVDPGLLATLRARFDRSGGAGIRTIQGGPSDPQLPPRSVDVAILSYRYHEIPGPFEFLHRLQTSLAPGGRLGIIAHDQRTTLRGTSPALLRCELEAVGYRQVELMYLTSAGSYLAIFEPPEEPVERSAIRPCTDR